MQSRLRNWSGAALVVAVAIPAAAVECMHPSHVPAVRVEKSEVCWSHVPGAGNYDVIVGLSLAELGSAASTLAEASLSCFGAAVPGTCVAVPLDPAPGDGFYFAVRANRGKSAGTFSTGCPTELAGRDEALGASATCP